jgi:hypothetical protein
LSGDAYRALLSHLGVAELPLATPQAIC